MLLQEAALAHHRRKVGIRNLAVAVDVMAGEARLGEAVELVLGNPAVAIGVEAPEEVLGCEGSTLGGDRLQVLGIDEAVAVLVKSVEPSIHPTEETLEVERPALVGALVGLIRRLAGLLAVRAVLAPIAHPAAE